MKSSLSTMVWKILSNCMRPRRQRLTKKKPKFNLNSPTRTRKKNIRVAPSPAVHISSITVSPEKSKQDVASSPHRIKPSTLPKSPPGVRPPRMPRPPPIPTGARPPDPTAFPRLPHVCISLSYYVPLTEGPTLYPDSLEDNLDKIVRFEEQVQVMEIPSFRHYDHDARIRMWQEQSEKVSDFERNCREFEYENSDWTSVLEEEEMVLHDGKLKHPATYAFEIACRKEEEKRKEEEERRNLEAIVAALSPGTT